MSWQNMLRLIRSEYLKLLPILALAFYLAFIEKVILDPWKATAFTAITGKNVYARTHAFPKPTDEEAYEFLRGGCTDTDFLRRNGISIIYSRWSRDNPDLVEVRKNVYLLKETAAK